MSKDVLGNVKKSTFLVTGGAGFIGSNLVCELIAQGHQVTVLDNFVTGKRENIDAFMENKNFHLIEGDIIDIEICNKACRNIDYVLHHAALGSVPSSIENPLMYHEVNVCGTLNMLYAARENNVKRFIYATSSAVYGDDNTFPKVEEKIGNLLSPYALNKRNNEDYAKLFYHVYNLETIGLRYFNVYGRNQDPNGVYAAVIPKFINEIKDGKQVIINGDGTTTRDFVNVMDVVQANIKACFAEGKDVCGKVFNIGFGRETSINELYKAIKDITKSSIEACHGEERAGDIKFSYSSIAKAEKFLNYSPKITLMEGLKDSIMYYLKGE